MPRELDADTREIIASFIAEGYERLDDAEAQLNQLGDARDAERLNSVFRLFHSVKGSAAFLGFENIKKLTHEAEALIELFIKRKVSVSPESLDVIFATVDSLRDMIAAVEKDLSDEACADESARQTEVIALCAATLRARAAEDARTAAQSAADTDRDADVGSEPVVKCPPPLASPPSATLPSAAEEGNAIALNELVTREMVEKFLEESQDSVTEMEKIALALNDSPDSINSLFRAAHTVKGNAGFFGYGLLEALCMEAEAFLDGVRRGSIRADEAMANGFISRLDEMRRVMSGVRIIEADRAPSAESSSTANARQEAYKPIGQILVEMGAAREEDIKSALEVQDRPLGQVLVENGSVDPRDIQKALDIQKTAAGASFEKSPEESQRKEIRVDTTKLDKLFDLVGELITAESMVINSPDLAGLQLDSFNKAFARLSKISREIQETTMMIRMIPMEGLFHKMTRLVRDLSRKFSKPVELKLSGQETEMDKNVIEQISDPLVHIIRNAIDHGLEDASRRIASGKPQNGVLSLSAHYEGSEIWVSVRDDGAGLDRERILAKALQKGLVKEPLEAISDQEAWNLIFEPGFSTAATVTDVSGRGVGMDVVKKNIERIRGSVEIKTQKGKGTEFILKIPLTMAIVDGITVRAGGNFYSLPVADIMEFFKARPEQITETEKGGQVVNLRGSILPLIKLGEVFRVPGALSDPCAGILIVVRDAARSACLLIDEVVGNQQIVVKSLSEYLGRVEGISGCSILGDGRVSFIIDTAKLLSLRIE